MLPVENARFAIVKKACERFLGVKALSVQASCLQLSGVADLYCTRFSVQKVFVAKGAS